MWTPYDYGRNTPRNVTAQFDLHRSLRHTKTVCASICSRRFTNCTSYVHASVLQHYCVRVPYTRLVRAKSFPAKRMQPEEAVWLDAFHLRRIKTDSDTSCYCEHAVTAVAPTTSVRPLPVRMHTEHVNSAGFFEIAHRKNRLQCDAHVLLQLRSLV